MPATVHLEAGAQAPFSGYLMAPARFQTARISLLDLEQCEKDRALIGERLTILATEQQAISHQEPTPTTPPDNPIITRLRWAAYGFAAGLTTVATLYFISQ